MSFVASLDAIPWCVGLHQPFVGVNGRVASDLASDRLAPCGFLAVGHGLAVDPVVQRSLAAPHGRIPKKCTLEFKSI